MGLNLRRVERVLRRCLDQTGIDFEYENDGEEVCASASIRLTNIEEDFMLYIEVVDNGMLFFRVIINDIGADTRVLKALNNFNFHNAYFKAYITDQELLEMARIDSLGDDYERDLDEKLSFDFQAFLEISEQEIFRALKELVH